MTDPETRYEPALRGALGLQKRVFWLAWICFIGGVNLSMIEVVNHTPWWFNLLTQAAVGLFLARFAVRGAVYWPFIRARRQRRRLDRTR